VKHLTRIYLLGVVALLLSAAAWADTLEFKDGRVIEGKFLGGTQETVRFQNQGQIQVYRVADLLALTFGGTSGALPPVPSPPAAAPAGPATPASSPTVPAGTYLRVRMTDGVVSDILIVVD